VGGHAQSEVFHSACSGNQANTAEPGGGSGRADATEWPVDASLPGQYFNLLASHSRGGAFGDAGPQYHEGPQHGFLMPLNLGSLSRSFAWATIADASRRALIALISPTPRHYGLNTVINASNYGLPIASQGMRRCRLRCRLAVLSNVPVEPVCASLVGQQDWLPSGFCRRGSRLESRLQPGLAAPLCAEV